MFPGGKTLPNEKVCFSSSNNNSLSTSVHLLQSKMLECPPCFTNGGHFGVPFLFQ